MSASRLAEPDYFATQVISAQRFHLRLSPGREQRGSVVSGGCEICAPDYDLRRAGFQFLTLELVIQGAGAITLGNQEYPLTPGTAFIYGGEVPHRINVHPVKGLTKHFIATTGREVSEWISEAGLRNPSVFQVRGLPELTRIFESITAVGRGDRASRQRLCLASVQHLIMRLGDLMTQSEGDRLLALSTYRRCRVMIEEGCLRFQSVQEIAAACHVAPEYLCRLFKRFRRQSPFQYLQSLKMNRAVELLHEGKQTVRQVAEEVGFSDPYHFSRAFKRIYGLPPSRLLPNRTESGVE